MNLHDSGYYMSPEAIDKEINARRRSVDVGGLALALGAVSLGEEGIGNGWGGWEEDNNGGAYYAELLSDMYTHTQSAVNVSVPSLSSVITEDTRRRLIDALDSWNFEPHKLPEEEVLACTEILFETLFRMEEMQQDIGVSLVQLSAFLRHLRQVYRSSNSYHNFQHALDVFQATHSFLRSAGAVPPVSILLKYPDARPWKRESRKGSLITVLTNEDLFALYIAAIGHDVGHPGFNNIFMKNAQTPLSQVYDHKSPLEQMHCAFLRPIMKRHGLAHLLDRSTAGTSFRKLLLETVLATDMAVHAQFMERFTKLVSQPHMHDLSQIRILLCQALIKCADISNPSRPHAVSQHWSAALAAEWANQALLEKHLQLPNSVQASDDPVAEAKGQIFFIQTFTHPLLKITSAAIPEMRHFADRSATNCQLWKTRLDDLILGAQPSYPPVPYRSLSSPQPPDFSSVFPLSLPTVPKELFLPLDDRDVTMSILTSNGSPTYSVTTPSTATPSTGSRSPSPFANGHESGPSSMHHSIFVPFTSPSVATNPLSPENASSDVYPHTASSSPVSPRAESFTSTTSSTVAEPMSVIRAAYNRGVRKKKSFHRSSWTPSPSSLAWNAYMYAESSHS